MNYLNHFNTREAYSAYTTQYMVFLLQKVMIVDYNMTLDPKNRKELKDVKGIKCVNTDYKYTHLCEDLCSL